MKSKPILLRKAAREGSAVVAPMSFGAFSRRTIWLTGGVLLGMVLPAAILAGDPGVVAFLLAVTCVVVWLLAFAVYSSVSIVLLLWNQGVRIAEARETAPREGIADAWVDGQGF